MQFNLTEERQMLQDGLRRFLADVDHEAIGHATDSAEGIDLKLWESLTEMGLPGAMFAEDEGGFGGHGFDIMVVAEELGRAGLPSPLIDSALLAGSVLSQTRSALVDEIVAGRIVGFAHAEPGSRYDLSHVETRAERVADGWKLTGQKAVVHHASVADGFVVSARIDGETDSEKGIALFLLETAEGLTLRDYPLNGGGRAAEMTLDVTLSEDAMLTDDGFDLLRTAHARAVAGQCAEALGMMERIKALTVEYLQQRRQFGQPIGKFQALQHRMADVLIEIEQARSSVINLCGHLDQLERDLHVAATKNLVGRVARQVVEEAIQMHGGIGMTMEYALGHFAKRLSMVDHRFGDTDYHLERFIHLAMEKAA